MTRKKAFGEKVLRARRSAKNRLGTQVRARALGAAAIET
jgi:hypothetical protein